MTETLTRTEGAPRIAHIRDQEIDTIAVPRSMFVRGPDAYAIYRVLSNRGLKWAIPVALVATPAYLGLTALAIQGAARPGLGWLNVLVFLFFWNAMKFAWLAVLSPLAGEVVPLHGAQCSVQHQMHVLNGLGCQAARPFDPALLQQMAIEQVQADGRQILQPGAPDDGYDVRLEVVPVADPGGGSKPGLDCLVPCMEEILNGPRRRSHRAAALVRGDGCPKGSGRLTLGLEPGPSGALTTSCELVRTGVEPVLPVAVCSCRTAPPGRVGARRGATWLVPLPFGKLIFS